MLLLYASGSRHSAAGTVQCLVAMAASCAPAALLNITTWILYMELHLF